LTTTVQGYDGFGEEVQIGRAPKELFVEAGITCEAAL
jgi:hypothetical protein